MNHLNQVNDPNKFTYQYNKNHKLVLLFVGISILGGGAIGFLIVHTSAFLVFWLLFGLISVLVILYKSEYALLAMIFIAYTYASNVLIVNYGLPSLMKPLMGLIVFLIFFRWIVFKEKPKGWQRSILVISGYGFIGVTSFLYATDVYAVREWLTAFAKDAVIAVVIAILFQRLFTLRHLVWVLLIAGIFLGSLTTYQQLTGTFDNSYGGFSKAQLTQIVGESNDWRSGGPGFGPNGFGQIMVVLVPFAIERMWNERRISLRILAGWALVVCVLSVFYTFSRSAFVGLVVVTLAMLIYRRFKPLNLLITLLLIGILLTNMPTQYTERLLTLTDFIPSSGASPSSDVSFRGRISENLAAWNMFMDHPILGVGLHNYQANYLKYSRELGLDPRREGRTPHNLYLEIASEMGLLGLGWLSIFLWMVFRGLRHARKKLYSIDMQKYDGLIMAIGVSIVGFLITSLYQHLATPRYFWMLFGIALAIPDVIRQEVIAYNQKVTEVEVYETR